MDETTYSPKNMNQNKKKKINKWKKTPYCITRRNGQNLVQCY